MERTLALTGARAATVQPLRDLLALRSDDPFAARTLARLIGEQSHFLEGVRAGYRYTTKHGGDVDSPLAWHEDMRARDRVPLPWDAERRSIQPWGTPRDVVEFNGYRLSHALGVACEVIGLLDPALREPAHVPAWRTVFITGNYTMILGDALGRHEDTAFAAAFLAGTGALLTAEAEADGAADPVALARGLAERWELPGVFVDALAEDGPDTLADTVRRAAGAAASHGFDGGLSLADAAHRAPGAEPVLDDYPRDCGGPGVVASGAGAMMAIALIAVE